MILDDLFIFPIVMVDGDNEERKGKLGLPDEDEVDIIIGEAECPYYELISISDRWLPTSASLERALQGKFDACYVLFANSGGFVVPWSKKRFKTELKKFADSHPKDITTVQFSNKEEVIGFLQNLPDEKKGLQDGE